MGSRPPWRQVRAGACSLRSRPPHCTSRLQILIFSTFSEASWSSDGTSLAANSSEVVTVGALLRMSLCIGAAHPGEASGVMTCLAGAVVRCSASVMRGVHAEPVMVSNLPRQRRAMRRCACGELMVAARQPLLTQEERPNRSVIPTDRSLRTAPPLCSGRGSAAIFMHMG